MFTPDQVMHYQTFGYIIMRNVFTPAEIKTMQREFDTAMARTDDFTPTDGESTHTHAIMLGDDTPFLASTPFSAGAILPTLRGYSSPKAAHTCTCASIFSTEVLGDFNLID